jgi:hypothetical protein
MDLAIDIVGRFLARGHEQGWSFDESLEWSRAEPAARSLDEMVSQFRDLVLVKQDGAAARQLRDKFLTFVPEGQEHVPMLEAIYARGGALEEDGTLVKG